MRIDRSVGAQRPASPAQPTPTKTPGFTASSDGENAAPAPRLGLGTTPLPPGWRWARLGDVCELNPRRPLGMTRSPRADTTFVPMAVVDDEIGTIGTPQIKPYSEISNGYTYFEEGDVLFAKITPCMQNGKHAIALGLIDGIGFGTTEFHVLRPLEYVTSEWIHYYVRQPSFLREAEENFRGAVGQQRVPPEFLRNHPIPLPPLPDQRRIAAILRDQLDAVRRAREAALARLEAARALPAAFLRSVFESEEARSSPRVRLAEATKPISGGTPSKDNPSYWNGSIPWVAPQHMKAFRIHTSDQCITPLAITHGRISIVPEGAVLIVVRGMILVRDVPVAIAGRDLAVNQDMKALVTVGRLNPVFLGYFLRTRRDALLRMVSSSAHGTQKLETAKLLSLEIPIPPMDVQERAAGSLEHNLLTAERGVLAIKEELATIDSLPQTLLRRAFAGQI